MGGLFLNFCECELLYDKVIVYKTDFVDKDWLFNIREQNKNITFYREGRNVFLWDNISSTSRSVIIGIEPEAVEITIESNPKIFSKMLEDKIISIFSNETNAQVFRNRYSNTWEFVRQKDLFGDDGLKVFRCINFNTYYSKNDSKIIIGFCISTKLKNRFIWGREEFEINGISHADLYGDDNIIFANKSAIKRYIEARGLENKYNNLINSENKLIKELNIIKKTIKWLVNKLNASYIHRAIKIQKCEVKYLPYADNHMRYSIIPKPKRYFANDKEGTTGRYDEQLKKLRPYSLLEFSGKTITIVVITPKYYEGTVDDFVKKLKDNLSEVFDLKLINLEILLTDGQSLDDYKRAIYKRKFNNIDCAIIVISETYKTLLIEESPYYYCKAKYIGQGIPTQEIQIEKLKSFQQLPFIINNIALNIYAKLGGTPWGIEKTDHQKQEYIIGIGSTINEEQKTIMGIASVFDYTGKYFVGNCIPLSGFADYEKGLEESVYFQLKNIINTYSDEVRLIFHIFKSPSYKYEIKAVSNVIKRFTEKTINYAFVSVSYNHNFRLFYNDGKSSVKKGLYINISDNEALINFADRSSIPLRMTVDRRSSFKDVYYLAKQIYWFSHLSCRSYIPAKRSISITYPSIMTRMTEKLKKIEGWDYDILKTVEDKLWFI